MTLGTLLPPITAATILNIFVFAGAWRSTQVEKRTGKAPWYLAVGITVYGLSNFAFLYFSKTRPLASAADIFGAALGAEALGVLIVYALVKGFIATRADTLRERAPMILAGAFLLFVIVAASLKTV